MSIQTVLLPVFVQLLLIFALLGMMAESRRRAIGNGVRPASIALSSEAFPTRTRQLGNCYANQFEMPVLFLLAVIFGIVLHHTGWLFVIAEWLFVACRLAHAAIHVGSNVVQARGAAFIGSAAAVALMWALLFVGIYLAPSLA